MAILICPICHCEVRQVSSASLELAMFQHLLWIHNIIEKENKIMPTELRFKQFPNGKWIRTCQECMRPQVTKAPMSYLNESWRDLKCKYCKSEALDYGQVNTEIDVDED